MQPNTPAPLPLPDRAAVLARLSRGRIIGPYIATALWSSCYSGELPENDAPENMDDIADFSDCDTAMVRAMRGDCAAFFFAARRLLRPFIARDGLARTLERAAHDLWLTAQGHGAGFWDGDWRIPAGNLRGQPDADIDHGDALSDLAKTYGTRGDLYRVGDYCSGTVYLDGAR